VTDWRDGLLARLQPLPGIEPGGAVTAGHLVVADIDVVAVSWDFTVMGGSFGEADATAFVTACSAASAGRAPLVSLLRSGGTRLQEGMRSLIGIPRAVIALDSLGEAGVPHIAIADQPTTGGVWVAVGSAADLRVGVAGATVGFSGPRVVEAMTGVVLHPGANTAESAAAAGLLDAVVAGHEVAGWLGSLLRSLAPDDPAPVLEPRVTLGPARSGWEQVCESRETIRPSGEALLSGLLEDIQPLRGPDESVAAAVGRLSGRRVCGVALARQRAARVTPAGFRLLARAAALAGRLDLALVVLVDTSGADPLPASESAGVAAAVREAMHAVLDCAAPSICVVHGEGGSGGALAGAVCDVVGIGSAGWFAALGPEGSAATLRCSPEEAADRMGITPGDLVASGFADSVAPGDIANLSAWLSMRIDGLRAMEQAQRLTRRRARWSSPLGQSPDFAR
jgi:acetyl-CoA carboxylase alpha subunit